MAAAIRCRRAMLTQTPGAAPSAPASVGADALQGTPGLHAGSPPLASQTLFVAGTDVADGQLLVPTAPRSQTHVIGKWIDDNGAKGSESGSQHPTRQHDRQQYATRARTIPPFPCGEHFAAHARDLRGPPPPGGATQGTSRRPSQMSAAALPNERTSSASPSSPPAWVLHQPEQRPVQGAIHEKATAAHVDSFTFHL